MNHSNCLLSNVHWCSFLLLLLNDFCIYRQENPVIFTHKVYYKIATSSNYLYSNISHTLLIIESLFRSAYQPTIGRPDYGVSPPQEDSYCIKKFIVPVCTFTAVWFVRLYQKLIVSGNSTNCSICIAVRNSVFCFCRDTQFWVVLHSRTLFLWHQISCDSEKIRIPSNWDRSALFHIWQSKYPQIA